MHSLIPAALAGVLLFGAVPASAASAAPDRLAAEVNPGGTVVARYSFDDGSSVVRDESGLGHDLTPVAAAGGRLRAVARGAGRALQFPDRCGVQKASCPHAVLQSPSTASLNPGLGDLAFGATVKLGRHQTSSGQNVVQKGYSKKNSQYKLQVDGDKGRPSCVLVGLSDHRIRLVRSQVTVADGSWHDVSCRRSGEQFTIVVDGQVRGYTKIPQMLAVVNEFPLSIGGKGAYRDNDQFQGAIDDVWVRIDAS